MGMLESGLAELSARRVIEQAPVSIVIVDASLPDTPLVYANRAFERLTGYTAAGVIGKNCRFLQGPDTDRVALDRLRAGIAAGEEVQVVLKNYRANGEPFWNDVQVTPIHDEEGVRLLLGILQEVREAAGSAERSLEDLRLREIQHRVKNHLQMIVSLIRLQARKEGADPWQNYQDLARRIEGLQLLYDQLSASGGTSEVVDLGAYATQIVAAMTHLNARGGIRMNVDAAPCPTSVDLAVQIGLILSELITNALQHAFEGRESGLVHVQLTALNLETMRLRVSDDGIGLPDETSWPQPDSLGGQIVTALAATAGAKLSVDRGATGTTFTIDFNRDA